jgi:putative PIG3 family NAD(P)H quinone oxidoreductase
MKAIRLISTAGPDAFSMAEIPAPTVGPEEVLVQVRAGGLNRADLQQALGRYPPPPGIAPDLAGMEFSGEIRALGARAQRFAIGARVMGLIQGAAFAEQVVVHERTLMPVPAPLDLVDAAAVPEAFLTALDALVSQGNLVAGEWVLIHAAASGVGTAAIQLVRALGARAIGTVRSATKAQILRELGADQVIVCSRDAPRFADEVRKTSEGGVHIALDLVGGNYVPETLASLRTRGRLLLVGLLGGHQVPLDLGLVLRQRLMIQGTVMRARPIEERIAVAQLGTGMLVPLLESKRIRPVIHARLPMASIREAARQLQDGDTVGKVVLTWDA